jgi:hypothetical protein
LADISSRAKTDDKRYASEHRVLLSLTSAVLPIIVSHPLWTLPTSLPDTLSVVTTDISDKTYSAGSVRHNAVFVCILMFFVRRCSNCLGKDMRRNMPIILLPLLERASSIGNHSIVQTCAIETIFDVALSSGYQDISSLLKENFDYIMDQTSLQIRRHSKEHTPIPQSLIGVIDVVLRYIARDKLVDQSHVPIVGHILSCMLNHFDRLSNHNMSQLKSFDTVCAFRSINAFMDSSIDSQTKLNYKVLPEESEFNDPVRFELKSVPIRYKDDQETSSVMSNSSDTVDSDEELQPYTKNNDEPTCADATSIFVEEIAAINGISKRCIYLICHPDLRIQVICIETLLSGFQSLGKIGAHAKSLHGESASNPLLPAIAECWPSILARLRETSSKLHSKKLLSRAQLSIRYMMAADQEKSPSDASLIVLLSKLLSIVSELCIISDGFFASRFEFDVYPVMASILGDSIPAELDRVGNKNSQHSLLLTRQCPLDPVLECLLCAYQSSCKDGLARIVSSCGTILLPLLAHKGDLGHKVVAVLKAMLLVNCDVLRGPIHNLSGKPSDDCNANFSCKAVTNQTIQPKAVCTTLMAQRAQNLIEFIEQLPTDP